MKPVTKYLLLIILIAFVLYLPSLFGFYTNDDFFHLSISKAESFRDFLNFFNLVKGPEGLGVYRPITTHVFYFLGWKLFNLNPLGLHIVSFLMFFLVVYMVYKFTVMLTKKENIGLVSAFLYATSATHFGHFYYLATFQEVGLVVAFLFSVIYFIKFLEGEKIKHHAFSIVGFILAILSKENAIVLPVVFLLIYLFLRFEKRTEMLFKQFIFSLAPFALLILGYAYMRFFHYGFVTGDSYIWDFSIGRTLNTLGWYTLWSFNLPEMLVDFVGPGLKFNPNLFKFWSREIIPIFILFGTLIAGAFYLLIKNFKKLINHKSLALLIFCAVWFVVTLSPVLFLPIHKFTFYLTVPLVGISTALAHLLIIHDKRPVTILFLAIWFSLSIITLTLAAKTNWIATGQETTRRVHNYLKENESTLSKYKTIVFYDTEEDKELPWSPSDVLKVVLSDNNYFKVFWKGSVLALYQNSEDGTTEDSALRLRARSFLGY